MVMMMMMLIYLYFRNNKNVAQSRPQFSFMQHLLRTVRHAHSISEHVTLSSVSYISSRDGTKKLRSMFQENLPSITWA